MNIWDILILLVIAGIIIIAWRAAKGSGGCHGSCGSCAGDCRLRLLRQRFFLQP